MPTEEELARLKRFAQDDEVNLPPEQLARSIVARELTLRLNCE